MKLEKLEIEWKTWGEHKDSYVGVLVVEGKDCTHEFTLPDDLSRVLISTVQEFLKTTLESNLAESVKALGMLKEKGDVE